MERIDVEDYIIDLIKEIWEKHSYLGPWELEFIEDIEDYIESSKEKGIANVSLSIKQVEKILEIHQEFYGNGISMDQIKLFQSQKDHMNRKRQRKNKRRNFSSLRRN